MLRRRGECAGRGADDGRWASGATLGGGVACQVAAAGAVRTVTNSVANFAWRIQSNALASEGDSCAALGARATSADVPPHGGEMGRAANWAMLAKVANYQQQVAT